MLVHVDNLHCTVASGTDAEREWLYEYLSFPDEQARYKRGPAWKRGPAKIRMMSSITQTFPTGFLDIVRKTAAEEKIQVDVNDRRAKPCSPDPGALIDWLRDYQREAIEVAREEERGVFHHATGAGKTEVIVALGEIYPCTWLVLTNKKDLLAQTAERFARRTGEAVGQIGDGAFAPARVTVAMFQTIFAGLRGRKSNILKFLATVQGVIVDECHIIPASTFLRVLMALKNAYFRYGFSGTPFARGDQKSIFTWGALGPIIHRVSADTLIGEGILARPTIRMIYVPQRSLAKSWAEVYGEAIVKSPARNAVVVHTAKRATKPCLVFIKEIAHGRALEAEMRAAGEKVEFVWGQKKLEARQAAIRRLVHGDVDILICNVIFQEGIDIPELQSVVIASGGKSVIMALQDVGRGMRRRNAQGEVTKEAFEVFDIADRGCGCTVRARHRGCEWLSKHTRKRRAAYVSEKYTVLEEASPLLRV